MAKQGLGKPDTLDVDYDEQGNAQAQHELQGFDPLPAEFPALLQRPDTESGVQDCCGIKDDRNGKELPEQDVIMNADFKRLDSNVAERVVEEMADKVGEQHQPAGETDLAQSDAADEFLKFLSIADGRAVHQIMTVVW